MTGEFRLERPAGRSGGPSGQGQRNGDAGPREQAIVELAVGSSISLVGVGAILLSLDRYLADGSFAGD
jgi:hypothetical protein